MHSPISTSFNHNTSDRSEIHRYKLSPRGKLYLKTDAEGKQKRLFYLKLIFFLCFMLLFCVFFFVIDVADVTLSCFFVMLTKMNGIWYLLFKFLYIFFSHTFFLYAQCSASKFYIFFSMNFLNFYIKCCYGNEFVCSLVWLMIGLFFYFRWTMLY